MKNPIKLQVVQMPKLGEGVKGKRTEPSKPFEGKEGEGKRWTGKVDLAETFKRARAEQ